VEVEISNLVGGLTTTSPSLHMTNLPSKGCGQGYVTHVYQHDALLA